MNQNVGLACIILLLVACASAPVESPYWTRSEAVCMNGYVSMYHRCFAR